MAYYTGPSGSSVQSSTPASSGSSGRSSGNPNVKHVTVSADQAKDLTRTYKGSSDILKSMRDASGSSSDGGGDNNRYNPFTDERGGNEAAPEPEKEATITDANGNEVKASEYLNAQGNTALAGAMQNEGIRSTVPNSQKPTATLQYNEYQNEINSRNGLIEEKTKALELAQTPADKSRIQGEIDTLKGEVEEITGKQNKIYGSYAQERIPVLEREIDDLYSEIKVLQNSVGGAGEDGLMHWETQEQLDRHLQLSARYLPMITEYSQLLSAANNSRISKDLTQSAFENSEFGKAKNRYDEALKAREEIQGNAIDEIIQNSGMKTNENGITGSTDEGNGLKGAFNMLEYALKDFFNGNGKKEVKEAEDAYLHLDKEEKVNGEEKLAQYQADYDAASEKMNAAGDALEQAMFDAQIGLQEASYAINNAADYTELANATDQYIKALEVYNKFAYDPFGTEEGKAYYDLVTEASTAGNNLAFFQNKMDTDYDPELAATYQKLDGLTGIPLFDKIVSGAYRAGMAVKGGAQDVAAGILGTDAAAYNLVSTLGGGATESEARVYEAMENMLGDGKYELTDEQFTKLLQNYGDDIASMGYDSSDPNGKAFLEQAYFGHKDYLQNLERKEERAHNAQIKADKTLEEATYGTGTAGEFALELIPSMVGMGADAVSNIIVPGSGLIGMGLRVFGNSYNSVQMATDENGQRLYTDDQALLYGFFSAAVEMATEKIGGASPFNMIAYGGNKAGEAAFKQFIDSIDGNLAKGLIQVLKGGAEEGAEEVMSQIAQPTLDAIKRSDDTGFIEEALKNYSEQELMDYITAFAGGAAVSALMGTGATIVGKATGGNRNPLINSEDSATAKLRQDVEKASSATVTDAQKQHAMRDAEARAQSKIVSDAIAAKQAELARQSAEAEKNGPQADAAFAENAGITDNTARTEEQREAVASETAQETAGEVEADIGARLNEILPEEAPEPTGTPNAPEEQQFDVTARTAETKTNPDARPAPTVEPSDTPEGRTVADLLNSDFPPSNKEANKILADAEMKAEFEKQTGISLDGMTKSEQRDAVKNAWRDGTKAVIQTQTTAREEAMDARPAPEENAAEPEASPYNPLTAEAEEKTTPDVRPAPADEATTVEVAPFNPLAREEAATPDVRPTPSDNTATPAREPAAPFSPFDPVENRTRTAPESGRTAEHPNYGNRGETFSGTEKVPFTYAVVPAESLVTSNDEYGNVNPNFPPELQPRDRTRIASQAQVNKMSKTLIPELLVESATAQNGAPIIRSDGVVIGGNARSSAINLAYNKGNAETYERFIRENAEKYGIDPASIPERPVLVRVADGEYDWGKLAQDLNVGTTATYSATEQGMTDAANLGDILYMLTPDENGNINTAANKDFIQAFINRVAGESERGSMITDKGLLSQAGLERVENAIFAAAYGDTELLSKFSEELDVDNKNVINSLLNSASNALRVRSDIENGKLYDTKANEAVLEGVNIYAQAKSAGQSVESYVSQLTLNGEFSAEGVALAEFLEQNKRSAKNMTSYMNKVYDAVRAYGTPEQTAMAGFSEEPTLGGVLKNATAEYEESTGRQAIIPDYGRFRTFGDISERAAENGQSRTFPSVRNTAESRGEDFTGGERGSREVTPATEQNARTETAQAEQQTQGTTAEVGNATAATDERGFTGDVVPTQSVVHDTLTEEEKARPELNPENDTHVRHSDEQVRQFAEDRMNNPTQARDDLMQKDPKSWTDVDVETANLILENEEAAIRSMDSGTEKDKAYQRLAEFKNQYNKQGTETGRALRMRQKLRTSADVVSEAANVLYGEENAKKTRKMTAEQKSEIMDRVIENSEKAEQVINSNDARSLMDMIKDVAASRRTRGFLDTKNKKLDWVLKNVSQQDGGVEFLQNILRTQVASIASDYINPGIVNKAKAYKYLAALSNMQTASNNVGANTVFGTFMDSVSSNMSVPMDLFMSIFTGKRTVSTENMLSKSARKGGWDAGLRSWLEVSLDADTSDASSKYDEFKGRTFKANSNSFLERMLSAWERNIAYQMNTTDQLAKGSIAAETERSLQNLMDAENAEKTAAEEALYRSLQQDNAVTKFTLKIRNGLNELLHVGNEQTGTYGLGDFLLMFAKVPANSVKTQWDLNPLAIPFHVANAIKVMAKGSNATIQEQRSAVKAIGQTANGAALIGMAVMLSAKGVLGYTEPDDKDEEALYSAEGRSGLQINFSALQRWANGEDTEWQEGDNLVSLGWLPQLNSILIIGNMIYQDALDWGEDTSFRDKAKDITDDSIGGIFRSLMEFPAVSTISGMINAVKYANVDAEADKDTQNRQRLEALGSNVVGNIFSGFIPNTVAATAKGLDPYERNTNADGSTVGKAIATTRAKIPGAREGLPARYDAYGNPLKSNNPLMDLLDEKVLPGNFDKYSPYAHDEELSRLGGANGKSYFPQRNAPNTITLSDKSKLELSEDQKNQWIQTEGQKLAQLHDDFFGSPYYATLTDESKGQVLDSLEAYAKYIANKEVSGNADEEFVNKQLDNLLNGVDTYGTSSDRTALDENSIIPYYSFRYGFQDAVSGRTENSDAYGTIDNMLRDYASMDDNLRTVLVERTSGLKDLLRYDNIGVGSQSYYNLKDEITAVTHEHDKNGSANGSEKFEGLIRADIPEEDKRNIIENYKTVDSDGTESGFLTKTAKGVYDILTEHGYGMEDSYEFMANGDWQWEDSNGTLSNAEAAVAISHLDGLSHAEQKALYAEMKERFSNKYNDWGKYTYDSEVSYGNKKGVGKWGTADEVKSPKTGSRGTTAKAPGNPFISEPETGTSPGQNTEAKSGNGIMAKYGGVNIPAARRNFLAEALFG